MNDSNFVLNFYNNITIYNAQINKESFFNLLSSKLDDDVKFGLLNLNKYINVSINNEKNEFHDYVMELCKESEIINALIDLLVEKDNIIKVIFQTQ